MMLDPMDLANAHVVLFAFHDATQAAQVVAAARDQTGVRLVAVVGRSTDCEIRIVERVGEELAGTRWLASSLAVLDVLSGPLRVLAGSPQETEAMTLPDSDGGFATFGRLIPRGALVILVAFCDSEPAIGSFERPLGAALCRMPADCVTRVSVDPKFANGTGSPRLPQRSCIVRTSGDAARRPFSRRRSRPTR
jgi:hypothetical protein